MYPKNIVKSKISEVLSRDFGPSPGKIQRLKDNENPNLKQVFMSLPYTSFRCSKISSKLHRTMSKYTPNFQLKVAFQTIQLSSIVLPRLKPQKQYLFNSNVVYKYHCPCSKTYIGETLKIVKSRILQHRTTKTSQICQHIDTCNAYKKDLTETHGESPEDSLKRDHFKGLFTIIERNLHNPYARKTFEGLMITLDKPELNKQVTHRKTALICNCILPTMKPQPGPLIEQS